MSQSPEEQNFTPKEMFHIVKETRDFEIKLFWQRTNYFMLLNTAILTGFGYFLVTQNKDNFYDVIIQIAICIMGLFVCLAWIKITLGSKFWQVHWEQCLNDLQEKLGMTGEKELFGTTKSKERVKKNLKMDSCYDCLVMQKPSVSRWMYRTALFFFIVWSIASIYTAWNFLCLLYIQPYINS